MKLAISNIAWKAEDAEAIYALMMDLGVRGLEIAPGVLFPDEPDPFQPTETVLTRNLAAARKSGLELVSMQSLLFGVQDALLFGNPGQRARYETGLMRAIDLAARLGIANLVVGSPANRAIPTSMVRPDAEASAAETFGRLGDHALASGCRLAIEPNPAAYGTNFLTNLSETAAFLRSLWHPAVMLNLDLGALHLNGEFDEIETLLPLHADLISHVHISEPHLAPVPGDMAALHRSIRALAGVGWDGWVSIEMRTTADDRVAHVDAAIRSCLEAIEA
jgi:sugar phosphate isomerase/epimerase